VFELDTATFLRSPGPGVADALDQLARLLYPDRP
jgi:ABC-type Fe3+-hydroxamate transport system substrate-binding protein